MLLLIRVDVRLEADEFPDLCSDPLPHVQSGSVSPAAALLLVHGVEQLSNPCSNLFFLKMQLYLLHA